MYVPTDATPSRRGKLLSFFQPQNVDFQVREGEYRRGITKKKKKKKEETDWGGWVEGREQRTENADGGGGVRTCTESKFRLSDAVPSVRLSTVVKISVIEFGSGFHLAQEAISFHSISLMRASLRLMRERHRCWH